VFFTIFDFFWVNAGNFRCSLVARYREGAEMVGTMHYFMNNEFEYEQSNLVTLQNNMDAADKKEFAYDMRNFNFSSYLHDYWLGIRKFVFRLPEKSTERATGDTMDNSRAGNQMVLDTQRARTQ